MRVPSCVLWGLTKKSNCFVRKYRNNRSSFSVDPLNLTGLHNASSAGLSNDQTVGVSVQKVASKKGKGQKRIFNLALRHKQHNKRRLTKKGGQSQANSLLTNNRLGREVNRAGKTITKISNVSDKNRKLALRRLAALHAASRTYVQKK
mmetsp:Transcript_53010/g.64971  ORF Transcript_53010/g.64971 Transcript_53010/m.64971 type:complete len:148 (+) Transcript_53010:19-462(+)